MATSTFTTPSGGVASLILNVTVAPNASGDPAVFNRVRVQLDAFPAGTYSITHPYGTDVVSVPAGRRGRTTIDIGCAVTAVGPCDFAAALAGRFGPFLTPAPGATARPSPPPRARPPPRPLGSSATPSSRCPSSAARPATTSSASMGPAS